MQQRNNIVKIG